MLRAAAELNYTVNPAARRLAGGRNRLLGVHTFEPVFPAESADFYHPFLVGVEREAEALSYDLILFTSAAGPDGHRAIYRDNVNGLGMADACVLVGYERDRSEVVRLAREGFPFVIIGRREYPGVHVAYVGGDYEEPTFEAIGRLAARGHRTIAYLGSGQDFEPIRDRVKGYRRAVEAYGLIPPGPGMTGGDLVMGSMGLSVADLRRLVEAGTTAFVTEDDTILRNFLALAAEAGLAAPDDFSVVALVDPGGGLPRGREVSGMRVPRLEMGATAVRMLDAMLTGTLGPGERQVMLSCQVVDGDTIGPLPKTTTRRGAAR